MAGKPTMPGMAKRYISSTAKWLAAGAPTRSDSEVESLLSICRGCEWWRDGSCGKCGCRLNKGNGIGNKLRRATESCPVGKWGAKVEDSHSVIRRVMKITGKWTYMPIVQRPGTRNDLPVVWSELGYKRVAEIGVHRGKYSRRILDACPGCHLYCIDTWAPYTTRSERRQNKCYQETLDRLGQEVSSGRATILRKSSLEALADIPDGSLDVVFVDADHSFDECVMDIINWSAKVRSGGMVCVHDYCHMRGCGVMHAVDAYTSCHQINPWYVTHERSPTAYWVKA